jgi:hypothetical protein
LFIALNEFAYHLSGEPGSSAHFACYWLEWIMEFYNICRAKKQQCRCERRAAVPVDDKLQMDPIWIVWQIITTRASTTEAVLTSKIVQCLFRLYCIRYTVSAKKKRRYLIYFAVSLLTQPYSEKLDIIIPEYKDKITSIVQKVNAVYAEIKKNEIAPKTNYLFHNTAKADLDKTIAKLEMLNSMNTVTRSGGGGDGSDAPEISGSGPQ